MKITNIMLIFYALKFLMAKSTNSTSSSKRTPSPTNTPSQSKISNPNRLPNEIEHTIKTLVDNRSKGCLEEIISIFKKDFTPQTHRDGIIYLGFENPYKTILSQEKFLNKTLSQIEKKLTKYSYYEGKNFTGMRWINPKSYNGEIKKLLNVYMKGMTGYFEKKYFSCNSNLPEVILDNYNFFYIKYNEVKKIFQKQFLFKGLKKFTKCLSKTNSAYLTSNFGENYFNGKISVKKMLLNLKVMVSSLIEMVRTNSLEVVAKAMRKIIVTMKGIPGL